MGTTSTHRQCARRRSGRRGQPRLPAPRKLRVSRPHRSRSGWVLTRRQPAAAVQRIRRRGRTAGETAQADDWLNLSRARARIPPNPTAFRTLGIRSLAPAAGRPCHHGAARAGRAPQPTAVHGTISPLRLPTSTPGAVAGGGVAPGALLAAVSSALNNNAGAAALPTSGSSAACRHRYQHASAPTPVGTPPAPVQLPSALLAAVSGGAPLPGSTPDPTVGNSSGPSQESFPYFPVYVLDNNNGVVLFPGADQLATQWQLRRLGRPGGPGHRHHRLILQLEHLRVWAATRRTCRPPTPTSSRSSGAGTVATAHTSRSPCR